MKTSLTSSVLRFVLAGLALCLSCCETTTTHYSHVKMSAEQIASIRAAAGAGTSRSVAPATSSVAPAPAVSTSSQGSSDIDAEVAEIMAGNHSPLPPARSVRSDAGSSVARIDINNNTQYTLTVLYSGPSSKRVVVGPHGSDSIELRVGSYRVAAKVSNPEVVPFAGNDSLNGGTYDNTFYIVSR